MAFTSSFFDAELVGGEYDRVYSAENFAEYFASFIANGVFPNPSTNLQVVSNLPSDMTVLVKPGLGWINGYYCKNDSEYPLYIPVANGALPRIDAVVLRWSRSERAIVLAVKTGEANSNPVAPSLERSADNYELMLASIYVNAGATAISQSNITDQRSNSSLCGWVKGTVDQIDTTNLFAQFNDAFQTWFSNIQAQLGGNVATSLQNQINSLSINKVNVSDKANEAQAQAGTDDTKWTTPALVKAYVSYILATTAEAQGASNNTKLMTPLRVAEQIASKLATTAEAQGASNNTKLMTPLRVAEQIISKLATTDEAKVGSNTTKLMTPALVKSFKEYWTSNTYQAQGGSDDTTLMTPLKVQQFFTNRAGTDSEVSAGSNTTHWANPKQVYSAARTVFDKTKNRLVNINTVFDHFDEWNWSQASGKITHFYPSSDSSSRNPGINMFRWGDSRVLLVGRYSVNTGGSSYAYYVRHLLMNLQTKAVIKQWDISTGSNYYYSSHIDTVSCISSDGSLVVSSSQSYYTPVDMATGAYYQIAYHYITGFFKTPSKWGYFYTSGYSDRRLYYTSVGTSSAPSSYYDLGTSSNSSNYAIMPLGVYGEVVWYLDQISNTQYQLCKLDLSTGSLTRGVTTLTGTDNLHFDYIIHDGTYAYAKTQNQPNSGNTAYGTYLLRVNMADGSTNWSTAGNASNYSTDYQTYGQYAYYHYFGSNSTSHFFVYGKGALEVNRSTGAVTVHQLPFAPNEPDCRGCGGGGKAVQFSIPGLEDTVFNGCYGFNTKSKVLFPIWGRKFPTMSSQYISAAWYSYTYPKNSSTGFGGTITTPEVLGLASESGNLVKIIGGSQVYTAVDYVSNPS